MRTRSVSPPISRRRIIQLLAAAPAAAAVGGAALGQVEDKDGFAELDKLAESDDDVKLREASKEASASARCIAEGEEGLSRKERQALLEKMKGLEGALETLRKFRVADDVEPAFTFSAMIPGGRP